MLMAAEFYPLVDAIPSRALLACSTVNARHPIPADHLALVSEVLSQRLEGTRVPTLTIASRLVKLLAFAARELLRILAIRLIWSKQISDKVTFRADVLMKTWFYGAKPDASQDFYLGRLPELFRSSGLSCMTIGNDLSAKSIVGFAGRLLRADTKALPELALIPFWAPLAILWDQFITSWRLSRYASVWSGTVRGMVAAKASVECLSPRTFSHAIHYYSAREAAKVFRPRVFVSLYEGQPWEKLVWLGVKTGAPGSVVCGYQHAIVMPHSLGLTSPHQGSWACAAPDVVFASGPATMDLMKAGHHELGTCFYSLGSFRRSVGYQDDVLTAPRNTGAILVTPEGIQEEAIFLFECAIEAARLLPCTQFIFRCHPVLPFERIQSLLSTELASLPNVELSQRPNIADDFSRARAVLYRGSSVVLYAVMAGLQPFYLDAADSPLVDPLYGLDTWREKIASAVELAEALMDCTLINDEARLRDWRAAMRYVENYMAPADESVVASFVESLVVNPTDERVG
jgi:hypothetical protein